MNRLDTARRAQVLKCLCEGMSLRATARVTGVARMTIEKLLRDAGEACAAYQDKTLRNLTCSRVQCDEIWSFCYAKKKNLTAAIVEEHPDAGDVWTWTAIDADSKLIITWRVGDRTTTDAHEFMADLAPRLANRVQLTTDGLRHYPNAIDEAFAGDVDFATIAKKFAEQRGEGGRYSPPVCIGCTTNVVNGDPDPDHISTSYVERQNLTMRMHMRRFTRLTNAFSKKAAMHAAAVALHFMWYNFVKIHSTLRVTPAMAAGVSDRVWEAEDIVRLLSE